MISELCKDKHCHGLCLQEIHRAEGRVRPSIPDMALIAKCPHNKHGTSVFVRYGMKANSISVCEEDNVELITVELPGVVVHSVYKSPAEEFLLPPLRNRNMPYIAIGDFNSHNTLWGYTSIDNDGEAGELWVESNNISLIHNAMLYGRKGTTLTSYLQRQTFLICMRSAFSIQSPTHNTAQSASV